MQMKKSTKKKKAVSLNKPGILYVVATPIGNLEDITFRAVRTLKEVDIIAAEDTRHTRKLLTHFGISTPTMSYYKEKERQRTEIIINKLNEGKNVALVSDAGTPGISDPGSILVQQALAEKIKVEPIPGPSALTAALSVAGIQDNSFVFLGFAPSRKKQRQNLFESLISEEKPLVFFEAPHRLHKFLQECLSILGNRRILWCRELTKLHEEVVNDEIDAILSNIKDRKIKGESVLIIAGAENVSGNISEDEIEKLLKTCRESKNLSLKDAVQQITREHNLSRSAVYRLALKVWK